VSRRFGVSAEECHRQLPTFATAARAGARHQIATVQNKKQTRADATSTQALALRKRTVLDRALGDAVVVIHLAFIAFVLCGGALVIRWRGVAWLHLPAVVWGAYAELTSTICPLTPLENALRMRAGQAGYEGGFVEHYVLPIIYPAGLTPQAQTVIGVIVIAVNVVLYAIAWRRKT
jgi:hypothetical protein